MFGVASRVEPSFPPVAARSPNVTTSAVAPAGMSTAAAVERSTGSRVLARHRPFARISNAATLASGPLGWARC